MYNEIREYRMAADAVEKKLQDAASKGEVITLEELLQENPYLLHGAPFACSRNLLHVATMCGGQAAIVEEATTRNPQLAGNVDAQKQSPLHIAAARGELVIASRLVSVAPEMCWWRDDQGMNPVHVAAAGGHVEVLEELLGAGAGSFPAMERLHRGQTVLHLCVKHRQLRALKVLVERLGDLVCAKDDDGETLLHLAVRSNQLETIRYLVESNKIEKLTPNSTGKTALQILEEWPRHTDTTQIKKLLTTLSTQSLLDALPKLTDVTMVASVLIATMAFQAALCPPGGVWQGSGEAVMASTRPKIYPHFVRANTTALVSSLVTIFLITTGLPSENFYLLLAALYAMWASLAAIAVSYGAAIAVVAPNEETQSLSGVINVVTAVSQSMMGLVSVYGVIGKMYSSWKSKRRRGHDFATDPVILRGFYWIFQLSERRCEEIIPTLFPRSRDNI